MERSIIRNPDLVVALDIGSTYCGYAWQWRSEFEKNGGIIEVNENWGAGALKLSKTKSCILLKYDSAIKNDYEVSRKKDDEIDYKKEAEKYKIDAFGHLAESYYKSYMEDEPDKIHGTYYFFRRFKHLLYSNTFQTNDNIDAEDHLGQHVPLVIVISKLIEALKIHFMENLKDRGSAVIIDKVLWVVTVPAIWSDKAKKLMRNAAVMAGIKDKNLILAKEPEAAVIYCMFLPQEQRTIMGNLGALGQTFLVVDLGGLTADTSAVEVLADGFLKELTCSSGDIGGGQNINDAFIQTCHDSFAGDGWNILFQKSLPSEMMEMEDDFEEKKVQIGIADPRAEQIRLKVPQAMITELDKGNIKFKEDEQTKDCFSFDKRRNSFFFKSDYVRNRLFGQTISCVFQVIEKELSKQELRKCSLVVLVGGFAESPIVRKRIEEEIHKKNPDIKVVCPTSPYQAVMKGAVLFGHNPMIFRSRISPGTIGIGTNVIFDQKLHDQSKLWTNEENGKDYCKDIFDVLVTKGQSVILNSEQKGQIYNPMYKNQTAMTINIYRSDLPIPMYITDMGCQKIGTIEVDMPDTTGGSDREVEVTMLHGGTELAVTAKDKTTNKEFKANINFNNTAAT